MKLWLLSDLILGDYTVCLIKPVPFPILKPRSTTVSQYMVTGSDTSGQQEMICSLLLIRCKLHTFMVFHLIILCYLTEQCHHGNTLFTIKQKVVLIYTLISLPKILDVQSMPPALWQVRWQQADIKCFDYKFNLFNVVSFFKISITVQIHSHLKGTKCLSVQIHALKLPFQKYHISTSHT